MAHRTSERTDETMQLLAEGRTGLRLTESLMLALVDAKLLDRDRALAVIEIVSAAIQEAAADDPSPDIARSAVAILNSIANSMAAIEVPAAARPRRHAQRRRST
jgi:hypothetical protein